MACLADTLALAITATTKTQHLKTMATRSNIHFTDGDYLAANIYVHYDGYPENRLPELDRFFYAVEHGTNDNRFSDPSYLAAKFIVWYSMQQPSTANSPLDFLGIGPVIQDAGDAEYIYKVDCSKRCPKGYPVVTYAKV